jgi:hypothetical protein
MHKVRRYYNSCRSSENICSSSGGVQGKRGTKPDETQFGTKNDAFLSFTHLGRLMFFFTGFKKKSHPGFGPNSTGIQWMVHWWVLVHYGPRGVQKPNGDTHSRCAKFQRWEVALRYAYEAKNTTRFFLCWSMLQNVTLTMAQ